MNRSIKDFIPKGPEKVIDPHREVPKAAKGNNSQLLPLNSVFKELGPDGQLPECLQNFLQASQNLSKGPLTS